MALHHLLINKSKEYLDTFQQYLAKKQASHKHEPLEIEGMLKAGDNTLLFEFSLSSAVKIIMVLISLFLFWKFIDQTSQILVTLFFAVFLAASLYPSVRFFEDKGVPRVLSITVVFILLIAFIAVLFSTILPALISQAISLGEWFVNHTKMLYAGDFSGLPIFAQSYGPALQAGIMQFDGYFQSLQTSSEAQKGFLQMLTDNIDKITPWKDGITTLISAIIGFLGNLFLVLLMVFFIILDRESIRSFLLSFFPHRVQKYFYFKSYQVQEKLSEWIHGQMILFFFMGITTWIFLSSVGVEYALAVGFISGLGEFLPFIGPPMTLLIALPLAFGQGIDVGFYTIIFFACQQFVEGNILVPLVMEKAVGVSPLVTVLAMLIGYQFLGVLGAVMAIPLASIIGLFLEDLRSKEVFDGKEKKRKEAIISIKK